ncbi:lipo-like protein, partial [Salmonella enterica subsp. enterica serovar Enteritidis]|nr:lipo-like protein [Salmonella enterica subsp. enterica serovar Enteritidis]
FDYTALHWADKQKPLEEVAGSFGVFPETFLAPPLVPQAPDEEAPAEAAARQVMDAAAAEMAETFCEHFVLLSELATCRTRRRGES